MGVTIAVSVITTVVAAAGTYVGTYLNNISLARRQDQLDRVNAQLRDLYGPLVALLLCDRAMLPIRSANGAIVAFTGRTLSGGVPSSGGG